MRRLVSSVSKSVHGTPPMGGGESARELPLDPGEPDGKGNMSVLEKHEMSSGIGLTLEPPLSPAVVRSSGAVTPEPAPELELSSPTPALRPPGSLSAPESGPAELTATPEPTASAEEPLMAPEPDEPEPVTELEPMFPVMSPEPELAEFSLADPVPASPPGSFMVVVRLVDGNGVQVGEFRDFGTAMEGAQEVIEQFTNANGSWPFYAGRFIRPDLIVSVDLVAAV
jgi:hypothetical protein